MNHFERWFADQGDKTHRLNYPLRASSLVVDLGAYEGKWSKQILDKFNCRVLAFEPVQAWFDIASENLRDRSKAQVFHYGVGGKTEQIDIVVDADGSSVFRSEGNKELITIRSIVDVCKEVIQEPVALIKINIEGGEYDLLDTILNNDLATKFDNLQIQFHNFPFLKDCASRRNSIRERLAKTHRITYEYEWVWENWKKN